MELFRSIWWALRSSSFEWENCQLVEPRGQRFKSFKRPLLPSSASFWDSCEVSNSSLEHPPARSLSIVANHHWDGNAKNDLKLGPTYLFLLFCFVLGGDSHLQNSKSFKVHFFSIPAVSLTTTSPSLGASSVLVTSLYYLVVIPGPDPVMVSCERIAVI